MPDPQATQSIRSLQVDLSAELYDALMAKQRSSGCSVSELVQQGLRLCLGLEAHDDTEELRSPLAQTIESRLSELESRIMARVGIEIESRIASLKFKTISSNISLAETPAEKAIPPTVRQLQIGDIVQIRDPDSPHYMEHVRVSEVGIIRATVSTDLGNQTFLKRDLRFMRSEADAIA
jgi:hypothetical protein